jgi:ankyrin repeat protein
MSSFQIRFLWAIHTLNRVREGKSLRTPNDIRIDLETRQLPRTIKDFYDESYNAIFKSQSSRSGMLAIRAIQLLFCAQKKLSMRAFLDAPLSEGRPTAKELISSCEGLIIEDRTLDIVRFFHPSIRQYLREKQDYDGEAHAVTAEVCLAKMSKSNPAANPPFINGETPLQAWRRGRSRSREPVVKRPSSRLSSRSSSSSRPRSRNSDFSRAGSETDGYSRPKNNSRRDSEDNTAWYNAAWYNAAWYNKSQRVAVGSKAYKGAEDPIQDFHEYASIYWATHCSMSNDRIDQVTILDDMLRYPILTDPNHQFPCWIASVRKLLSQRPFGFYDERVELELEKCISEPPSPYLVACVYGFTSIVQYYNKSSSDTGSWAKSSVSTSSDDPLEKPAKVGPTKAKIQGVSDVHLACMFGRLETLQFLAKFKPRDTAFFDPDDDGKTALEHAVESARDAKITRILLFKTKARDLRRDNAVLIAAMKNRHCARDLVHLLLFRKGTRLDIKEPTEEVLIAALYYPYSDLELLKSCAPLALTGRNWLNDGEYVFRAATAVARWETRRDIWDFLLDKYFPEDAPIFSDCWAIEAGDVNLVTHLLKRKGHYVHAPYILLRVAASNQERPLELVDTLLKSWTVGSIRNPPPLGSLTDDNILEDHLMTAALENPAADGLLVANLCTAITTAEVKLDVHTLSKVAENRERGAELLQTLLDHKSVVLDAPYWDTFKVIETAVANGNPNILKILFTSKLLLGAFPDSETSFVNIVAGVPTERFLHDLQHKYATVAPTEDTVEIEEPQEYWDTVIRECLSLILEHAWVEDSHITQDLVERAALTRGRRVIEFLFDQGEETIRVTPELVVAAAKNRIYGRTLLELLLIRANDPRFINNSVVLHTAAAFGTLRTMKFLLRQPQENYTQEFCLAAAGNPDPDVVEFLFRKVKTVDLATLKVAAVNSDRAIDYLLPRWGSLSSTSQVENLANLASLACIVAKYCQRTSTLDHALSLCIDFRDIKVEDLLLAAAENQHGVEMLRYLFRKYEEGGVTTEVSEAMLEAAASNPAVAPEMLRVLLNECEDERIVEVITEEVLIKALRNESDGEEALRMLLMEEGVPEKMSENISEKILGSPGKNKVRLQTLIRIQRLFHLDVLPLPPSSEFRR